MSASLIGRFGSSGFRLPIDTVSMSLTGSCFSPKSAPRPFYHGIRERGGPIFWAASPFDEQRVQADMRSHLIHRPARDIMPPCGGVRVFTSREGNAQTLIPAGSSSPYRILGRGFCYSGVSVRHRRRLRLRGQLAPDLIGDERRQALGPSGPERGARARWETLSN
jgi:hypothetical protein